LVEDEYTITSPVVLEQPEYSIEPLTAVPATDQEYRALQAQLNDIQKVTQNITVGEEITPLNDKEAQPDAYDEESNKSVPMFHQKRVIIVAAIVILLCVGAILGVVISKN
jgi:hypothetical protein